MDNSVEQAKRSELKAFLFLTAAEDDQRRSTSRPRVSAAAARDTASNRELSDRQSGVRATCPDCHVPHGWTDNIARKMQASKEVWGKLFRTIDTREKFLGKRLELAQHEWARLKANDSLECRNCHEFASMDFTRQSKRASDQHSTALANGEKTCIDCHKGIAHRLPDATAKPVALPTK